MTPPAIVEEHREQGVLIEGVLGGGASELYADDAAGVLTLGLDALYYARWFEAGLGLSAGGALFGPGSTFATGLAGVKVDPDPAFRLELLAEGGAHLISNIGEGLWDKSLGRATVGLPYVGGRLGASFLLGGTRRFLLGGWFSAGTDIGQETIIATVEECVDDACTNHNETHTIGGASWSVVMRVGGVVAQF